MDILASFAFQASCLSPLVLIPCPFFIPSEILVPAGAHKQERKSISENLGPAVGSGCEQCSGVPEDHS